MGEDPQGMEKAASERRRFGVVSGGDQEGAGGVWPDAVVVEELSGSLGGELTAPAARRARRSPPRWITRRERRS